MDKVDVINDDGLDVLANSERSEKVDLEGTFASVTEALMSFRSSPERDETISGVNSAALAAAALVTANPRMGRRAFLALPGFLMVGSKASAAPPRNPDTQNMHPELTKIAATMNLLLGKLKDFKNKYARNTKEVVDRLSFRQLEKLLEDVQREMMGIQKASLELLTQLEQLRDETRFTDEEIRVFENQVVGPFEQASADLLQSIHAFDLALVNSYGRFLNTVSDGNFESEVAGSKGDYILQISTDWCGPCKLATMMLAQHRNRVKGSMPVGRLVVQDVEGRPLNPKSREVVVESGVEIPSFPTIVLYRDGKPVRFMNRGFRDAAEVGKFIRGQMQVVPRADEREPMDGIPQGDREELLRLLLEQGGKGIDI